MTPAAADPQPSFHSAWSAALRELELDVEVSEQLLRTIHGGAPVDDVLAGLGSWAPPTHLGQLPHSLADRARMILARQLAVADQLAQAALRSQQQLELQRRMRPDDAMSRPMYVDAAF
ncbi:MAG TPA: hypothetical protein VF661_14515 [Actinomycetales bacterium]|jgi:hypothetical protein